MSDEASTNPSTNPSTNFHQHVLPPPPSNEWGGWKQHYGGRDGGSMQVEFTIPGDVVPWARAGSKGKIRFTPRKQADYATAVKLICSAAMKGKPPLEGPIMLDLTATYPWPASMSARKRATPVAQWRTARPDIDNVAKIVGDALNRIAWADDSQIACCTLRKLYGDMPGLTVRFGEITQ